MKSLKKINLDFKKTVDYFKDQIDCGRIFSLKVLKNIDFGRGSFFTILPNDAALNHLYEFSRGEMIPQKPYKKLAISISGMNNLKGFQIINIDYELADFIYEYISKEKGKVAVFNDFMHRPSDPKFGISGVSTVLFNDHIHHLIKLVNTKEEIVKTIKASNPVWHFLTVLTAGLDHVKHNFTEHDFDIICDNAHFVITSAYDREGYIFWERSAI